MGDLVELRRKAAQQASTGNYWAGKVGALLDRIAELEVAAETQPKVRSRGAELITAERQRQVDVEGWTPEHDAEHDRCELLHAAQNYMELGEFITLHRPRRRGPLLPRAATTGSGVAPGLGLEAGQRRPGSQPREGRRADRRRDRPPHGRGAR
jgi:hypothetical protein